MKKTTFLFTLLALIVASSVSYAQSTSPKKITLKEAVNIALQNNFQIKQAENNLESAENNEFAAKMSLFTPDLNGSLRAGQTQGRQFNTVSGTIVDQITTSMSGGLSTSYTIFDGLRNIYNLRSATSSKITQQERLKRAKEDIIFNVATQYLTILLDNQLLKIAEENLKSSKVQLGLIKAQVEVGAKPVADLYNQESVVANNELLVLQRENAISNDKMSLIRSLQINPMAEYEFVAPEIPDMVDGKEYNTADLVKSAMNTRSDLKALRATIETNKFNYKSSTGQYMPTLSVSAGISSSYNDRFTEFVNGQTQIVPFGDQFFDRNRNMNYSFSLQIPIYNQFSIHNTVQRSKVSYKNSILDYNNQELAVTQEILRAYSDYISFSKQLESSDKALLSAKKALETQQERYNIGASTLIELTQSNAQFVEASSNRAQALFRVIFQEQLIQYYVGKINPDFEF
ncbi:TolC family protein [bacterium]|nr:MAG: TolC family protein [bacterium]